MPGYEAVRVIGQYLVDNADNIDPKQLFELGHALGNIEQIIMSQTKELILKESEVIK